MSWFNVACLALALPLWGFVLFSYEDEEKGLTAWIEKTWMKSRDTTVAWAERVAILIRKALYTTDRLLSRAYGPRLLALRAYGASFCFTQGFACLYLGITGDIHRAGSVLPLELVWVAVGVGLLAVPFVADRSRSLATCMIFFYLVVFGPTVYLDEFAAGKQDLLTRALLYLVSVVGALAILAPVDTVSIAAIRKTLRLAAAQRRFTALLLWVVSSLLVTPAMFGLVYAASQASFSHAELLSSSERDEILLHAGGYLAVGALVAPVVPAITSLVFIVAISLALVLRTMLEIGSRSLYMMIKFQVIEKRKLTTTVASSLIALAFPQTATLLEKVAKVIGGA